MELPPESPVCATGSEQSQSNGLRISSPPDAIDGNLEKRLGMLSRERMILCALTGGIGSGKSLVAEGLLRRNIAVIDADQLSRQVVAPESPGLRAIVEQFGPEMLCPAPKPVSKPQGKSAQDSGSVPTSGQAPSPTEGEHGRAMAPEVLNRAALGQRIFSDPAAKQQLEAILHPRIQAAFMQKVAEFRAQGHKLVVYEIPLLFETGQQKHFHPIVSVVAPLQQRVQRLVERDGLETEAIHARIASQVSDRVRIDGSDFVLHNDASPEVIDGLMDTLIQQIYARCGVEAKGPA